jgi:hypothetical protein
VKWAGELPIGHRNSFARSSSPPNGKHLPTGAYPRGQFGSGRPGARRAGAQVRSRAGGGGRARGSPDATDVDVVTAPFTCAVADTCPAEPERRGSSVRGGESSLT